MPDAAPRRAAPWNCFVETIPGRRGVLQETLQLAFEARNFSPREECKGIGRMATTSLSASGVYRPTQFCLSSSGRLGLLQFARPRVRPPSRSRVGYLTRFAIYHS